MAKFLNTSATNYFLEELIKDAYEEAQRIIRISDEVRISLERVTTASDSGKGEAPREAANDGGDASAPGKLSSSKLAQKLGLKTAEMLDQFTAAGFLALEDGKHRLTPKGTDAGCEFVARSRFGPYFLWPEALKP